MMRRPTESCRRLLCSRGRLKKQPAKTTQTPDELRVLGVLIEKELTTPEQYPLTLNAATNGANQKNNRDPVVSFDADRVEDALESLRAKALVLRVDTAGSRVPKYKHETMSKLGISRYELVILAELMLRGPQTLGELRGRASRMHHLDSLEVVKEMLTKMADREEPLVKEIPPSPGSRAERYVQLLCPDAHPLDAPADAAVAAPAALPSNRSLNDRIEQLERQVEKLSAAVRKLAGSLGEPDPLA
jgi:uncharacterized protein YceH (UPF0502 family)